MRAWTPRNRSWSPRCAHQELIATREKPDCRQNITHPGYDEHVSHFVASADVENRSRARKTRCRRYCRAGTAARRRKDRRAGFATSREISPSPGIDTAGSCRGSAQPQHSSGTARHVAASCTPSVVCRTPAEAPSLVAPPPEPDDDRGREKHPSTATRSRGRATNPGNVWRIVTERPEPHGRSIRCVCVRAPRPPCRPPVPHATSRNQEDGTPRIQAGGHSWTPSRRSIARPA